MGNSTNYIAFHYCVGHVPAATIPASRLSNILVRMHQGRPLTEYSLNYIQQQNLPGLFQLATGKITYEAYIAALDQVFVARQQAAEAEHKGKETQLAVREAEYLSRKSGHEIDREAQRKLHQKREREASEAVLKAQKDYQAERATQRERNRQAAADAFQARTNDPGYIAPTSNDIACHYHVDHIPTSVSPPLSDILDALFRGHQLTEDNLNHLKREAPPDLYKLALGQITFDSYIAAIEATEAAEAARIARESDPDYIVMMQTQALCRKHGLALTSQTLLPRMTNILRHIDLGNRLPEEDFVWLTTVGKEYFTKQLREAYHQTEAKFYAGEYRRTLNPWKAVSASKHFRKCDQPGTALELLDSLEAIRLKHPKLQSAVCTTRGGAMRDLGRRPEALQLGEQAHELQSENFRPCTLLGAVNMELGNFDRGREWYVKAEKRGASAQSIDIELQSIFQRADKANREAMKAYLLTEDLNRYRWVNDKKYQSQAVTRKL